MVEFLSIRINQKVIVKHKGRLIHGTVKYKGHLNGENGQWVGLELDIDMGRHNGVWRGREYFKCPRNCGLFTQANNIKFIKSKRHLVDSYRKVSDISYVDDTLFAKHEIKDPMRVRGNYSVDFNYLIRAKNAFEDPPVQPWTRSDRYPLQHAISKSVPAASMLIPELACKQYKYKSMPVHYEYADDTVSFNPQATIPHYTMPHEALVRQSRRGTWEEYGIKKPRFTTVSMH